MITPACTPECCTCPRGTRAHLPACPAGAGNVGTVCDRHAGCVSLATPAHPCHGQHGNVCADCLTALAEVREWREAQMANLARVSAWLAVP